MPDEEFITDERTKVALKKAKELEKTTPLSEQEIVRIYKQSTEQGGALQKLLKNSWFIRDPDQKLLLSKGKSRTRKSFRRKNL